MLLLGQTIPVLILARVLQGISAAVVWTIGLALVLDTVGPENLGKTVGSIFGFISIGELAAPVLGGVVYKQAGYGGVFGLGFAILAVDFIMRALLIEKKTARRWTEKGGAEDQDGQVECPTQGQEGTGHEDHQQNASTAHDEADESAPLLNKPSSSSSSSSNPWKIPPNQPRPIRNFPLLYPLSSPASSPPSSSPSSKPPSSPPSTPPSPPKPNPSSPSPPSPPASSSSLSFSLTYFSAPWLDGSSINMGQNPLL